jgi:hypothetical protein
VDPVEALRGVSKVSKGSIAISIILRLGAELGGKMAREVEESVLTIFFLEGVLAGVGRARSADDRDG